MKSLEEPSPARLDTKGKCRVSRSGGKTVRGDAGGRAPCTSQEGDLGQVLPHSPQKGSTLPAPWVWISRLQNCETKTACCLSYSVSGTLLRWPWQKQTNAAGLRDLVPICPYLPWSRPLLYAQNTRLISASVSAALILQLSAFPARRLPWSELLIKTHWMDFTCKEHRLERGSFKNLMERPTGPAWLTHQSPTNSVKKQL